MAVINFGPWAPDQPRLDNTCITATNVYPTVNGYKPFPGASVITNALTGKCLGSITFRRTDGVIETFCGDATKLYRLGGTTFADVSNGTYAAAKWRFAVYGNIVIATNNVDTVQQFDVSSDSAFSDLSAAPVHSFPFVIRDVLVAADVNDGTAFQVKWSAVNDSSKWTADCGGGAQIFPDGGPLVGATGGEIGVVFQENALTIMNFVGGDLRFTFDKVEGANGCLSAGSIVQHKGFTYYLSETGFQVFNGVQSQNISVGKVSDTFFANLDRSKIVTLQGVLDLSNDSVVWAYATSSANAGENDKLIIFHIPTGNWSEADIVTQTLLEDEISPNLLGNDAQAVQTGVYTYLDKVTIASLNFAVSDIVSARALISDANVVNGRVIILFWTSGDVQVGSAHDGNFLNSTSGFEETKVENVTVPATTAKITVQTAFSSGGSDMSTKEAVLNVGATARDFASTDGKILAAFDTDNKLARYSGSDLTAVLSTGDLQLAKDRRAFVKSVRGLIDSAHDVTVGKKDALAGSESTVTGSSNSNGKVSLRANARYHRFQLDPTATWTEATGIDVEAQGAGRR